MPSCLPPSPPVLEQVKQVQNIDGVIVVEITGARFQDEAALVFAGAPALEQFEQVEDPGLAVSGQIRRRGLADFQLRTFEVETDAGAAVAIFDARLVAPADAELRAAAVALTPIAEELERPEAEITSGAELTLVFAAVAGV